MTSSLKRKRRGGTLRGMANEKDDECAEIIEQMEVEVGLNQKVSLILLIR